MERFLVFIALLFSWTCLAATPGNAPILTIAASGQQTQALSIPLSCLSSGGGCPAQVFSLYGGSGTGSGQAGHFFPLYQNGLNGSTSGYRVASGKTAYCFNLTAAASTGGDTFQLVSDTAIIAGGTAGTTTLTAGVYQGGAAGAYVDVVGPTAGVPAPLPGIYTFGSLTYVGVQITASVVYYIHLDCYEQ